MQISSDRVRRIRVITEFAANLTLLIAVPLAVTLWLRQPKAAFPLVPISLAGAATQNPEVGTKINLPGVTWRSHPATLVMAISSACHFCVESTPFYSQITGSPHAAPIVVVMPQQQPEARAFLLDHAITPSSTVSLDLGQIRVGGTPTLLLVSSSGTVTKSWVGELSETQQKSGIGVFRSYLG